MNKLQRLLGFIGIRVIRIVVRLFGRKVSLEEASWLKGPIGPDGEIGGKPYEMVAEREGLTIEENEAGALVQDFGEMKGRTFDPEACDPNVRHFYEHTAEYKLDVWSETRFPGRLFLWILVSTVSRYMNQLNFPVFGLEMSKGMSSRILSLKNEARETVYTGWFRQVKEPNRVIYTGFYSEDRPPNMDSLCVKVVFPLPLGNATVFLKPTLDENGQFQLVSSGKRFGDPGFYRTVAISDTHLKVLYLKALKERFTVYTDDEGILRCNHTVRFMGMLMLRLHYRMHKKREILRD